MSKTVVGFVAGWFTSDSACFGGKGVHEHAQAAKEHHEINISVLIVWDD